MDHKVLLKAGQHFEPYLVGLWQSASSPFFKPYRSSLTRDLYLELSALANERKPTTATKIMAGRFSEWLEAINYSSKTSVNYTRDVKGFLDWLADNTLINSISAVTPAHLQQYQIALYNFERHADDSDRGSSSTPGSLYDTYRH